jgi:3-oxoacyl-[acyl-carrier protein] reductase
MESGLKEKVVCITGASGGIGRALAECFAEEGAQLVLCAYSQLEQLEEWVGAQEWSERALVAKTDVRQPRELKELHQRACERWGRVDVCVANAGIWPEESLALHEMSEERILHTVDVDLLGATWTARAFLASLAVCGPRKDGHGASLVFIGSTAGRFGEAGHCDYSLSKAGMYGLLRTLKNEIVQLDPFGRVNLVEPGWTATPMAEDSLQDDAAITQIARTMPLRQIARAQDIARAVAFLSSPLLARHLSGEVLTVAGGMEGRALWRETEIEADAVRRRLDPD